MGASYFKSDVCTRDGQLVTYDEGATNQLYTFSPYHIFHEDQLRNYLFSDDFLNDLHLFSITGKNTWTISIYPGDTCGKSGATVTPIPYLLYGGCLPVGHGDLNYAAFIAAPSLSCSPTFAPTVTPSAVPTKNKIGGHVKSCPKI